ncbi:MAG TPA: hypothetical protein PLX69_24505 [Leptospiraceae bacterium]|nr:hypothetical protein [Leptospiraceae bacterium]HRG77745.1 hypothetical protein [Leptospiraceae bacterium]
MSEIKEENKLLKSVGRIILGVFIGCVVIFGALFWFRYGTEVKQIAKISPLPVVSSFNCDDNSTLGETSAKVLASIINRGGEGEIVVEATVLQGGNQWTKTQLLYLRENETGDINIVFDEVSLFGGGFKCSVNSRPN